MRRLSRREHLLLLAAFLVAAGMTYGVLRLRPRLGERDRLDVATRLAGQRLKEVRWPQVTGDPDTLEQELEALRASNAAAEQELRTREECFVSRRGPGELNGVRLEVSTLAHRCGLSVLENVLCPPARLREFAGPAAARRIAASPDARLVRFLALGEPYELQVREVTLGATFRGLLQFLRGLEQLEVRIVVLRLEVAVDPDRPRGGLPLRATLLIGL